MGDPEHEIAELQLARRQLAVWRNRFFALLDRTPVPTAICLVNGTVLGVNPAMAELFGTSPRNLHGRAVIELVQPRSQRDYERVVRDLVTGRRTRRVLAVRWAQGTGQVTVQAVDDDEGTGLLVTLQPDPLRHNVIPELTERERAVLRLVARGASSAEAAAELGITADGVNYHLTRLTARLSVPNRAALIARSYTLGLLDATAWPPR
ncbi:hypothetical protein GCM10010174_85000 [Kutzneria viridogrisea]|uniref:HTH luxR-type domain-containing protein n=2 Tax=Kutzneria TaxID=43356 RepID=W5W0E1_9PSEU|nr:LuxR C-terminal-related transcriptional regulator [Kutzneria albida]AHH94031.1 hypothetical protein KALB_656 [Kutzneria albida DSM 43870]MBA8930963.1 PAS domain S-box-containing protein [Kutzneria viridogrisea]